MVILLILLPLALIAGVGAPVQKFDTSDVEEL